jgi:hypothetical protein
VPPGGRMRSARQHDRNRRQAAAPPQLAIPLPARQPTGTTEQRRCIRNRPFCTPRCQPRFRRAGGSRRSIRPGWPGIASVGRSRKVGRGQRRRADDRRGFSTGTSSPRSHSRFGGRGAEHRLGDNSHPSARGPSRHRFDRPGSARRTDGSATDGHRSRGTPVLAKPGSLPGLSRQALALRRVVIALR